MNREVVKWATGVTVILTLVALISGSAIRLNAMEVETDKVKSIERQIQIITLYLKLQDPDLYHKAENLAK